MNRNRLHTVIFQKICKIEVEGRLLERQISTAKINQ
jgi:hypothetical protein